MKLLSEKRALERLHELTQDFATELRRDYEHRAKSCARCMTPGACCLDAHFVNVHITGLEAVAIRETIDTLIEDRRSAVLERIDDAIEEYDLSSEGDTFAKTFACPLFEKGIGCAVHQRGKPLPCIAHACYEDKEDLPPDELLAQREGLVEKLNELTYRMPARSLPIPIAIKQLRRLS